MRLLLSLAMVIALIAIPYEKVRAGECLSTDEEMYMDMLWNYENALKGEPYYEGSTWCWKGYDPALNRKLEALARRIVKENKLNPEYIFESITLINFPCCGFSDKNLSDNVELVLTHIVRDLDKNWDGALRLLNRYFDAFDSFVYIYKDANKVTQRSRKRMLEVISQAPKVGDERWLVFLKQERDAENDEGQKRLLVKTIKKFEDL